MSMSLWRVRRKSNAIISIPAESAVFFKCFYELVITEKYHAAFCSGDDDIPEEILAQFLHDLCRKYGDAGPCGG